MSILDNLKKFAQPYAEDDYDDYDEDDYDDDYEEPVEAPRSRRRSAPAAAPVSSAPILEDEEEEDSFGFAPAPAASTPSMGFSGQVVNRTVGNKQEVVLFRPNSFNDSSKAADELRNRKAVIVNLENVDKALSRRVIDFLSGCVYALEGSVEKIAQSAYLFCPHNMDIVGSLDALQVEVENYV